MRYSLRWLLIAVAFVAISVVALLNANEHWVRGLRNASFVILSAAIVCGVFLNGRARAFWIGFAVFGWLHFFSGALDYYPPFHEAQAERELHWMYFKIAQETADRQNAPPGATNMISGATSPLVYVPSLETFKITAHCLKTLCLAVLGGGLATWCYSRRRPSA